MDKRKKLCRKSIEVIWKREDGCNSRAASNCLPELKEINLEDSVKKPVTRNSSLHAAQINKKNKERAHKRVRRSLFPGNKIEKLNKYVDVNKSREKRIASRESSRLKSPKLVSNRGKTKYNQDISDHELNQRSFRVPEIAESSLTSTVRGSSIIPSSVTDEGKIIPHATDFSHSKLLDTPNKKSNNDCNNFAEINLSDKNKLKSDKNKLVEYHYDITCSKKISDNNLSKASKILTCSESFESEKNVTSFDGINQQPFQTSTTFEPLHPRSVHKTSDVKCSIYDQNQDRDPLRSSRKRSGSLLEASQVLPCLKSPTISNPEKTKEDPEASVCESKLHPRKTAKVRKTESSPQFSGDVSITKPSKINQNEKFRSLSVLGITKSPKNVSNRKCNLNKASKSNNDKLNVTATKTDKSITKYSDCIAISSEIKCDNLSDAPQTLFGSGSSQIISNRKKSKLDKDIWLPNSKRCLLPILENTKAVEPLHSRFANDESVVNAPNTAKNLVKPHTKYELSRHKSPKIMTNRKLHFGNNMSDKFNVSKLNNSVSETNELLLSCLVSDESAVKVLNTPQNHVKLHSKFELSRHKSPEILTNRKLCIGNNISDKFNITDLDNSISKTNELLPSCLVSDESVVKVLNTPQNQVKPHSKFELSRHKSPEIMTSRKLHIENHISVKFNVTDLDNTIAKINEPLPSCLVSDELVVNASNTVQNQVKPRTKYELSRHKSPEIMTSRKINIENNISDKFNITDLGNSIAKINEPLPSYSTSYELVINVLNSAKNLVKPHTKYELSRHKSPEIMTNQKLHTRNNISDKFDVSNLNHSVSKTSELLPLCSASDELVVNASNTAQNQVKPCTKYKLSRHKSPDIMTNRKIHIENNISDKVHIVEFNKSDTCRLNNNYCERDNSNPKKRSYGKTEASQLCSYLKVPQIVPNREKMNAVQETWFPKSKRRLFQTTQSTKKVLPSNTVQVSSLEPPNLLQDKVKFSTDQGILKYKSPEINSNQKVDCLEFSLRKKNISNNDSCNTNKLSINSNRNYKTYVNTQWNSVLLKSNSEHSEDIVEASEIICPMQTKRVSKTNKIHCNKKLKLKRVHKKKSDGLLPFVDPPEINLQENEIIETNKKKLFCESVNSNCIDIINSENVVKSPCIESKIKNPRKKLKKAIIKFQDDQNSVAIGLKPNDIQSCPVHPLLSDTKKLIHNGVKDDSIILKPHKKECLNKDKNENCSKTSTEICVILATPERNVVNVVKPAIENFSETFTNVSIPLIEVDQSPKTPQGKNQHLTLIQSVYSPPIEELPGIFESVPSPAYCSSNTQRDIGFPFKIDSIVSPATAVHGDSLFSPEPVKKKISNHSPSPNHFDSAKKRKKVCKDGLRGKFRELISRKKSEACIREYEKTLSKNYQLKQEDETVLLNVIELWKEFNTFVLLCYRMQSDTAVQKVLVTLDNCPKNVIKYSIIRIYSPWSTIESKTIDLLIYVGVIHAEVIECPGPSRPLGPSELFPNFNGLLTTMYQNEVLWKCNCSKDIACQCLGELSVYNYLQYMVSHKDV